MRLIDFIIFAILLLFSINPIRTEIESLNTTTQLMESNQASISIELKTLNETTRAILEALQSEMTDEEIRALEYLTPEQVEELVR